MWAKAQDATKHKISGCVVNKPVRDANGVKTLVKERLGLFQQGTGKHCNEKAENQEARQRENENQQKKGMFAFAFTFLVPICME